MDVFYAFAYCPAHNPAFIYFLFIHLILKQLVHFALYFHFLMVTKKFVASDFGMVSSLHSASLNSMFDIKYLENFAIVVLWGCISEISLLM